MKLRNVSYNTYDIFAKCFYNCSNVTTVQRNFRVFLQFCLFFFRLLPRSFALLLADAGRVPCWNISHSSWKSATRVFDHSHELASCCWPSLSILGLVEEHTFGETSWSPLTLSYIGYGTRFRWLLCSGLLARRWRSEKVEFDVRASLRLVCTCGGMRSRECTQENQLFFLFVIHRIFVSSYFHIWFDRI